MPGRRSQRVLTRLEDPCDSLRRLLDKIGGQRGDIKRLCAIIRKRKGKRKRTAEKIGTAAELDGLFLTI
jgi:hypothetical protein